MHKNKINLIVACGNNGQIGLNNKLLWHIPEDFKHFKEKTINSIIIMGRNTYESLPGILSDRKHIIISSKEKFNNELNKNSNKNSEIFIANSIDKSIEIANSLINEKFNKIWVIGGAQIYNEFMKKDLINKIYLSLIDYNSEADTYFNLKYLSSGRYKLIQNKKFNAIYNSNLNIPSWELKIYERIE